MKWVTRAKARVVAVASGFRELSRDDSETMDRQFPIYDALYAYCRGRLARGA